MYWRVSVFFVRQRRGRPVGVCLTNSAGSWSRPYETGRKVRYFSGHFQPLDAVNNLLLCWFTSTFPGTLGHFKKKFCALNILSESLSDAVRQTLGFRQTFLTDSRRLTGLSDAFYETLGFPQTIFQDPIPVI